MILARENGGSTGSAQQSHNISTARHDAAVYVGVDPWFATAMARIVAIVRAQGYNVAPVSGRRTTQEQADLYAEAAAGRRPHPVAKPGHSRHEWGLALDLGGDPKGVQVAGRIAPLWGIRWGGNWATSDPGHFEVG